MHPQKKHLKRKSEWEWEREWEDGLWVQTLLTDSPSLLEMNISAICYCTQLLRPLLRVPGVHCRTSFLPFSPRVRVPTPEGGREQSDQKERALFLGAAVQCMDTHIHTLTHKLFRIRFVKCIFALSPAQYMSNVGLHLVRLARMVSRALARHRASAPQLGFRWECYWRLTLWFRRYERAQRFK